MQLPSIRRIAALWLCTAVLPLSASATCTLAHDALTRYALCDGALTWSQARDACLSKGMHLVEVDGAGEWAWVADAAASVGGAWWVGPSAVDSSGVFDDGYAFAGAAPWCVGEPLGSGCVVADGGCWRVAACDQPQRFVCEDSCDDADPCTIDDVNAATGQCEHTSQGGSCDDGSVCTIGDACLTPSTVPTAPGAPLIGTESCVPGFGYPQCATQSYDASPNLAVQAPGGAAAAVAKESFGGGSSVIHRAENLNDGLYGNGASWIALGGNNWAKIDLGISQLVGAVRLGRDRLGYYADRPSGHIKVWLAGTDAVYANGDDSDDAIEYDLVFDTSGSAWNGYLAAGDSVEVRFAPRPARFVKIGVAFDGGAIDEIEVLAGAGPACQAGAGTLDCDDGIGCTVDTCDAITGCSSSGLGGPCDDGNPCTTADTCSELRCMGTLESCPLDAGCNWQSCGAGGSCQAAAPIARWIDTSAPSSMAGGAVVGAAHCGPTGWTGGNHAQGGGSLFYETDLPAGGYAIWIRYSSGSPRPIDVFMDSAMVADNALNSSTGSYCGAEAVWTKIGEAWLDSDGSHVLELRHDTALSCCFPHIDDVLVTNVLDFVPAPSPVQSTEGASYGAAGGPSISADGPCDDHNACTTGETCVNGTCTGVAAECAQGEDCVWRFCDPSTGCQSGAPIAEWIDTSQPAVATGGAVVTASHCGPDGWTGGMHMFATGSVAYDTDTELPAGNYGMWIRYAAEVPRPIDVLVDDALFADNALNSATGSWCGTSAAWAWIGEIWFHEPGAHRIELRYEPTLSCCFPHIDDILVTNVLDFVPPTSPIGVHFGPADGPTLDGATCDDGNACTLADTCSGGVCVAGAGAGAGATAACDDGNPCTIDDCDAVMGCVHTPDGSAGCTFALAAVIPSASEAGATREFELVGAGLAATTSVEVPGASVTGFAATPAGSLLATIALPPTAGVFDVTVHDAASGLSSTLVGAITTTGTAACAGVSCGACTTDADCVEGDACTTDLCVLGVCRHEPSEACCPTGSCTACDVAGDIDGSGAIGVTDVQCVVITTLWSLAGKIGAPPSCLAVPLASVDADCNGSIAVGDIVLTINRALGVPVGAILDADADGCVDACTAPPQLTCAPNATALSSGQAGQACAATWTPSATGADACFPPQLSLSAPGVAVATCTAVAPSGQSASCEQSLTLVDDVAPQIGCTPPQTVECTGPCATAPVTTAMAGAIATDNCGPVSVACPGGSGPFCRGVNAVTCIATDPAGNSAACTSLIEVRDTTGPVLTCADPSVVVAGAGGMAATPDALQSAVDACDAAGALAVQQTPAPGTLLPPGEHGISVVATDTSGNVGSCQTTFTVQGIYVDADPYGSVLVYEDAGSAAGNPCLSGPAPTPFPGTDVPVVVRACFTPDFQSVVSVAFSTLAPIEPAGPLALAGTYDSGLGALCMTGTVDTATDGGSAPTDSAQATACIGEGGGLVAPPTWASTLETPAGVVNVEGTYDAATDQLCLHGSADVSALNFAIAGTAEVCLQLGPLEKLDIVSASLDISAALPPFGTAQLTADLIEDAETGTALCVEGEILGDTSQWLPVADVALLQLIGRACVGSGGLGAAEVSAIFRLGQGPDALVLRADAAYTGSSNITMALGLADQCPAGESCNGTWSPFAEKPALPGDLAGLTLDTLGGSLTVQGSDFALEVVAGFDSANGDGPITLIEGTPGLALNSISVRGFAEKTGGQSASFGVSLQGQATIPLGFDSLLLDVEGAVGSAGLELSGSVSTLNGNSLTLFENELGPNALSVSLGGATASLTVTFSPQAATVAIAANATLGLFGSSVTVGVDLLATLDADGWKLTVAGILQQLQLAAGGQTLNLGEEGVVVLVASSDPVAGYAIDADGDPANGDELVLDIERGITLKANADLGPLGLVELFGSFGGEGASCLEGSIAGNSSEWLAVPGVSVLGMGAKACIEGNALSEVLIEGAVRFGTGPQALEVAVAGAYNGPNDISLSVGLAPGCQEIGCAWKPACPVESQCAGTWTPFAGVPGLPAALTQLQINELGGTLALTANGPKLDVAASVGGSEGGLPLIVGTPGLFLDEAGVSATLEKQEDGSLGFRVYLGGQVSIPLDFDTLVFAVSGEVTGSQLLLKGSVGTEDGSLSLQPFKELLGDGTFVIGLNDAIAQLDINFVDKKFGVEVSAGASMELFDALVQVGVQLGIGYVDGGWGFTLAGILQQLDIPLGAAGTLSLGDAGHVIVAASSRNINGYAVDADGDPTNGKELEVDLKLGLNLLAQANLTFLDEFFPGASAGIAIHFAGKTSFSIGGTVALPVTFIRPEDHVPGLHSLGFQQFELDIKVSGKTAELGVGGSLQFVPIDRQGVVQAPVLATGKFLIDSEKSFGGEVFLDGQWREPFLIPNFATMNPGFSMKLQVKVAGGVPIFYPVSIGLNAQSFFRKSGEWPVSFELDATGSPVNLPDNILAVGGTFFFDKAKTTSGICIPLKCLQTPTLIVRFDLQNLALSDIVLLANQIRQGVVSMFALPELESLAELVPVQDVPPIDISPLDVQINQALVYLSTHNTEKFGVDFTTGIRLVLDGSVTDTLAQTHTLMVDGFLSPSGLRLSGQVSPIEFIPGLEIVGDPYRRRATLAGGSISVPDSNGLDAPRTVEGWVRTSTQGALVSKSDGANGYELRVGPMAPTNCTAGAGCPNALTLLARLRNGGVVRELASVYGVIQPDIAHHVALTLTEQGDALLFVDGSHTRYTDSVPGVLPGPSGAALSMGQGLGVIDDVRIWNEARVAADLLAEQRVMPFAFRFDPTLVARYEFDFDLDGNAYNSRVGGDTGHGVYAGPASATLDPADQDLFFKIVADYKALGDTGLSFRGGLRLDFDPPLAGAELSYSAEATLAAGEASGTLYVRELPLLGIPGVGGFRLTGNGPNAVAGDFDDGLYLSGDLMAAPAPTLNASTRLLFVDGQNNEHLVSEASFLFDCLKPAGCPTVLSYTLRTQGALNVQIPLGSFGSVALVGNHLFDTDQLLFHVDGSLTAFGQTLIAGDITLSSAGASLMSSLDLTGPLFGDLDFGVSQEMGVELTFQPPRMCAQGATSVSLASLGSFDGAVDVCLGTNPHASFFGTGTANVLGIALASVDVHFDDATGLFIDDAQVNIPGLYTGSISGHYVSPTNFELTGTTSSSIPGISNVVSTVTLSSSGAYVNMQLNPGCPTCVVQSSLQGAFTMTAQGPSFVLEGAATVQIAGITLGEGFVSLTSAEGLKVFGKAAVGGTVVETVGTADGSGAFTFSGALNSSFFGGVGTLNGTATFDNSGISASGTATLWSSSGAFALSVPAGASAGPATATAQMQVSVPTDSGNYPLANAVASFRSGGGQPEQILLSGTLGWPGVSAAMSGTVNGAHHSLSGAVSIGAPGAFTTQGSITLDDAGASLSASVQAGALPAVAFAGQINASVPSALQVQGTVSVGGAPLASSTIHIGPESAAFSASHDLGSFLGHALGTASMSLSLHYATVTACGTGSLPFPLEAQGTCNADACIGFASGVPSIAINSLQCGGLCLGDSMCAGGHFCDAIGHCWPKRPNGEVCAGILAGDHECQSGFCDPWLGVLPGVCANQLPDGIGCIQPGQCLSGYCGSRPGIGTKQCYTPGTAYIDQPCFDANHCAVGGCWGLPTFPSICLCTADSDCANSPNIPAGTICKAGDWGITPYSGGCIPPRQVGEDCYDSGDCAVGLTCSGGGKCYAPASKGNWEECFDDGQCKQGKCSGGLCRCESHSHCTNDPAFGANSFCDQDGRCTTPKKATNVGEYCGDGAWCQSGLCGWSANSNHNVCYGPAAWPNYTPCDQNMQCATGKCYYWFLQGHRCGD